MLYEYALISVLIACGYWGWFFVRRSPSGTPTFGLMQLAAAGLAGLGLLGRHYDSALLGLAGAVGVGAGTCLLVVGPLLRALARRLAAAERLGVAARLLDIADVLAPGSGVADEMALLGAMKDIRDGRVDETISALTAAKDRAPGEAKLAIDERIAMLYLAAYRWSDAIAHAEAHMFGAVPVIATGTTLRDELGLLPQVFVELLGAYGRTGDLDRAGSMLERLEIVCGSREDAALWVHRARMMFLALAGRPEAVRVLTAPRLARHMTAAARTYWVAVAHQHRGDREAATAAYEKARTRSRGRPRELIEQALAKVADASAATLTPTAQAIVERVEAAPLPAPIRVRRARGPWATWTLTGAVLAVATLIALALGPSSDLGVLLRAGAMVRSRVDAGEWWRLVSCVFVHVGGVHLAVNVIGLYFLGRVAEELFGGARTVAIFGLAGLAGSLASYAASPALVSAGASGGILGLLGAVFLEITLHRGRYRAAWKRGLWGGLVVITVAQVATGFFYPVIDQWAHGAGLFGGAIAGALLSPHVKWARVVPHIARVLAGGVAALSVVAALLVARTTIADSLDEPVWQRVMFGDVTLRAPASWVVEGGLHDREVTIFVEASRESIDVKRNLADRGFDQVATAREHLVAMPPGWTSDEYDISQEDAMGNRQRFRAIHGTRGRTVVLLLAPTSVVRAAPALFHKIVASVDS